MNLNNKKIVVTGGGGFLGQYVVEKLKERGVKNIFVPRSAKYNLCDRLVCQSVIKDADVVIHLAAQIGGIGFIGEHQGEIFYNNLIMGVELMEASYKAGVKKFVSIGTVCEYPKEPLLPFKEEDLWEGYPEETTAPYGWAKKMLIVQGNAYKTQYGFNAIHLLPVNLYGPGDNFVPRTAHVIPALIRRIVKARNLGKSRVEAWGTGKATREFLYVKDAAEGIVLATQEYDKPEPVNLGSGQEIAIKKVVELIVELTGYKGDIEWNKSKPDGQPRRQLDVSMAKSQFGFSAKMVFRDGLKKTIDWYEHQL